MVRARHRRGAGDRRGDRGGVRAASSRAAAPRRIRIRAGEHVGLAARRARDVPAVPLARGARPRPDDRAGVLLQRDLLHLRADADALLRRAARSTSAHYLLPFALGNFLGPLVLGRLFDVVGRRPMIAFTYAASGLLLLVTGAAVRARAARRATTHTLHVVGLVLLRLGGGELGLPHGERAVPARAARDGDRAVLRRSARRRRARGARAVRHADRVGQPPRAVPGLRARRR